MEALRRWVGVAAFACALAASAHDQDLRHGPPPAPPGLQSLDVYRDGAVVHLLTGEQRDAERSPGLWHRRSTDGGATWSAPVRVDRAGAAPNGLRPGNDAQVAASGERLVAVWGVSGSGWGGSGPLVSALSEDGGKNWKPGAAPSDTGSTAGQAFADLLFTPQGLDAVWLDGRDKAQGLRQARSTDFGRTWSANTTVAAQTCECCWNTLVAAGDDLYVLYRSKAPRDMHVAVNTGKGWQKAGPVAAFGWEVKGCPETGGGLVAGSNGALHALTWTGLEGREGLYYTTKKDASAQWSIPTRLGTRDAQHSDLASRGGELLAVWDEITPETTIVLAARWSNGEWGKPARLSSAGAEASHPRAVSLRDGFLVVWGERSGKGERTLATVRLP